MSSPVDIFPKLNEWTDAEKELLINIFPKFGPLKCSEMTGRSKRACQEMAKKLNLKRKLIYDDKNEFTQLVKSCTSYTDCVIKLGLSPRCSGNFQTIKKYIKLFEIDISHFSAGFKEGNLPQNKKNLKDILTKNSFFSRTALKKKLYVEGIKEKKCEICGMGEDWHNGSKIVHILDHINGDPYDNRIENLRIVCPNCNSTLPTNNGRNKKVDNKMVEYRKEMMYHKCKCGKLILKVSKNCRDCYKIKQRKFVRPDIMTLKKDIEELGYKGAGKKYGISDNGIRKWLK